MTITIRKHAAMSLEQGVATVWIVHLHHHEFDPDGELEDCTSTDYLMPSWNDALNLTNQLLAKQQDYYMQHSAFMWQPGEEASGAEYQAFSWICHTCTEARGEMVRTPDPAQHLGWHRKRLAGREEDYRNDMAELEARRVEDIQRSYDGRTDWDYDQRIARLERDKAELLAAIARNMHPSKLYDGQ